MAAVAHMKTEGGVQFPMSDYAYVGDPERVTTWKLRLTESPGKVTLAQLSRAVQALSPEGFMGEQVDVPPDALPGIKRRIRTAYVKLGVDEAEIPAEIRESSVERTGNGLRESSIELSAPVGTGAENEAMPPGVIGISPDSVLLRAGVNKTRRRKYTEAFIREHLERFQGSFSSIDHPSMSEAKDRPERSIADVAAVIMNPRWDTTENAAVGDVHYINNTAGREMLETYRNPVIRERAGLSIYWPGDVRMRRERLAEGNLVDVPMQLLGEGRFDVDFVTRPSAGGRVGALRESEDTQMLDELTIDDLLEYRPDLVEAIRSQESETVEETVTESDTETEVTEEPVAEAEQTVEETVEEETEPVAESDRIAELEATIRTMRGREIIHDRLRESDLPEQGRSLVEADLEGVEWSDETEFTARVDARIAAVGALVSAVASPRVRVPHEAVAESVRHDVAADIQRIAGL